VAAADAQCNEEGLFLEFVSQGVCARLRAREAGPGGLVLLGYVITRCYLLLGSSLIQGMRRLPFIIGVCVFLVGVALELLLIALLPGSFAAWFALPDRSYEFAARLGMHLINGLVAGYCHIV